MAVLAAENVSYTYQSKYQKVQALKNVSCTFEAGKFYAIIGQSGSGKSTLLSMLAGLGTPSYTAQMAYPMIYHDPMNAFMICLRPSGAVSGAEPIPAVRALKKRSVKNPQELKEKILIFEAGLDDAAVELVKNAIVTVVRKNLDGNVHAYFCAATEEELRFALFVKGRQEPVYQTTKMAVYRQSQEVLRTLDYKSPDDFAVVNSKLAQSLLDEYKSI